MKYDREAIEMIADAILEADSMHAKS